MNHLPISRFNNYHALSHPLQLASLFLPRYFKQIPDLMWVFSNSSTQSIQLQQQAFLENSKGVTPTKNWPESVETEDPSPILPTNLSLWFTQRQLNPTFGTPLPALSSPLIRSSLSRTQSGGCTELQRKLGIVVSLGDQMWLPAIW